MSKRTNPIEKAIAALEAEIQVLEMAKERLLRSLPAGAPSLRHGVVQPLRRARKGNSADGPASQPHEQPIQG